MDYEAACAAATTRQGLDPVVAALSEAGVKHEVQQTGGFCMVVIVPVKGGIYGVTNDAAEESDPEPYLVCWYPGEAWQEAEPEESYAMHSLESAVATIKAAQEG